LTIQFAKTIIVLINKKGENINMITTIKITPKLIFGPGALNQLPDEAKAIGRKKLMIVTYPDIRRVGHLDRVLKLLEKGGITNPIIFEKVMPNPRATMIDEGAAIARREKVDFIIGLGGGSAMDSAKCIGLAGTGTKPIWDYYGYMGTVENPSVFIQIPTMAGTGSEMNVGGVVTDWENSHEKNSFGVPDLLAKVVIVDPELTLTVPKRQIAAGGLDILTHLAEFYLTAPENMFINDGLKETMMKAVVKYLPIALEKPNDMEARIQLSWASTVAMSGLARIGDNVGTMSCHGMEEAMSGRFDICHGEGLAAIFPTWMHNIQPVRQERNLMFAYNVFGRTDVDGTKALEDWLGTIKMKLKLRDLGFNLAYADQVGEIALRQGRVRNNPVPLTTKEVGDIYRAAY
jgi:alcohol dehydrogenase class IV